MKTAIPELVTVGAAHSPKAYADEKGRPVTMAPLPELVNHHFSISDAGELVHAIEGRVRAVIPPEGMREYAELWPDSAPLVKSFLQTLRAVTGRPAPGAKPATASASAKRKGRSAKTRG